MLDWAVLYPPAGAEDSLVAHFWAGFVGAVVLLPVLAASAAHVPAVLAAATPLQLVVLMGIGALGTFGHLMLVVAMGLAPTATLMPFIYAQIGWAAPLGWLVFCQLPEGPGWAGMALIAACSASAVCLNSHSMAAA